MSLSLRQIVPSDQQFLWEMLYQSLYVPGGEPPFPLDVVNRPEIARYAADWGRAGDLGFVALKNAESAERIGAAWLRLLVGADRGYGHVDNETPELAMAVLREHRGQGVGSALLTRLMGSAAAIYGAVSLSVSADNPALRLYERNGFEIVSGDGTSLIMFARLTGRAGLL
jgi:ribosomal protein S18 acetylase RimI-like enzyme